MILAPDSGSYFSGKFTIFPG